MARKAAMSSEEAQDAKGDAPVLDTNNSAIKTLIKKGKERGYVTHDELNAALPQEELTSEQIEDVMSALSEMGVNVIDSADNDDSNTEEGGEEASTSGNLSDSDVSGSDDPVRMYLREMGTVELLSREGEIAIAKRIEAGREMMIGGLYESPLTIRALIQWRRQVEEGVVPLRDIIDLDTTYTRLNGTLEDQKRELAITNDNEEDELEALSDEDESDDDPIDEDESDENSSDQLEKVDAEDYDDLTMLSLALEEAIRETVFLAFDEVETWILN